MSVHPHAATDKRILETLKEVHNNGAGLYNAGQHAEAFHLYLGALVVARPFLDHRPAVQAVIADGLAEVAAVTGNTKLNAFRLHEVIEQVRADLKAVWKAARAAGPATARVAGVVTEGEKPVSEALVAFAPADGGPPANVGVGDDGAFLIFLAPGEYAVTVTGAASLPAPLLVEVRPGHNALHINVSGPEGSTTPSRQEQ